MLMLAPFLCVVTLFVLQSSLPVAACRHTSAPPVLALKMYSPCITAVEVLLNSLFEGTRFSGQRKLAAGGPPLNSIIKPLTSNRFPRETRGATEALLLVARDSLHKDCPLAGCRHAVEV